MVQRLMDGPEFSVDLLCDRDGRCLNAIPRTMLESRGGESIKGAAIADPELIDLGRAVAEALPLRGPATVQMFRDRELGLRVTDINARFGGAFACPMYAAHPGPQLPRADRAAWRRASAIEPHVGEFLAGRTFTRFFWQIELDEELQPTGRDIVPGRPAPAALMRSLLITIVALIAVLALLDVVVTPPEDQAVPAAARDPDRHFASRPDLARRRSPSKGAARAWSSSPRSARPASPAPRSSTPPASTSGSSRCPRASSPTTSACRPTAASRC